MTKSLDEALPEITGPAESTGNEYSEEAESELDQERTIVINRHGGR